MSLTKQNLDYWLARIVQANPYQHDMVFGLERVKQVMRLMSWSPPACPIIVVGGTNGKGSCVATLAAIYSTNAYHVGTFSSPILFNHTEMVKVDGHTVSAEEFCRAYAQIFAVQNEIPLTPFEYHTLAAIEIFHRHNLDVWIMEVGLGGRLDAVNCLDADVAVITSIDFDHMQYLGHTKNAIATEKAGILRANTPAVYGDNHPPAALIKIAQQLNAPLYWAGKDFKYQVCASNWNWYGPWRNFFSLPFPQLMMSNIATAIMAVELCQNKLAIAPDALARAIAQVTLPARMQKITLERQPLHIIDVAHNPAAIAALTQYLIPFKAHGKIHVVFSMLQDKDIPASVLTMQSAVDYWYVAPLLVARGAEQQVLTAAFKQCQISQVQFYATIAHAYEHALHCANLNDVLVVCGSFHTVSAVANACPNLKNLLLNATLCTRK